MAGLKSRPFKALIDETKTRLREAPATSVARTLSLDLCAFPLARNNDFAHVVLAEEEMKALEGPEHGFDLAIGIGA